MTIDDQKELPFRLARLLPEQHYARKNLGYLLAISRGCECIYETDDDNAPTPNWSVRNVEVSALRVSPIAAAKWANVYEIYTSEFVWPRGLPLSQARSHFADGFKIGDAFQLVVAPIQQGLANGSPDVDAVWRLIFNDEISFREFPSVVLPRGTWCPFNSQNTWWWKPAFPLLYLPSLCSFRMTDIWRGLVAQRCLWELGHELEFHSADVKQQRNAHDLTRDFRDEVSGYLRNEEIRDMLETCGLSSRSCDLADNIRTCYEALVRSAVVEKSELTLLEAWLDDCAHAMLALGNLGSAETSHRDQSLA